MKKIEIKAKLRLQLPDDVSHVAIDKDGTIKCHFKKPKNEFGMYWESDNRECWAEVINFNELCFGVRK